MRVTCVLLCDGACRLCMTQNTSNMLPFVPPLNYDASAWELARRYISAANVTSLGQLMILSGVGEGKTDTNNRCYTSQAFACDVTHFFVQGAAVDGLCGLQVCARASRRLCGRLRVTVGSDDWPGATEGRRREIWQLHKDYTQGLMWFLQHDDALPLEVMPSHQTPQGNGSSD